MQQLPANKVYEVFFFNKIVLFFLLACCKEFQNRKLMFFNEILIQMTTTGMRKLHERCVTSMKSFTTP